ncbi:hypothetical protein IKW75_02305 [Candidatus Saccharibacteria bacterium]|nr:hypothetical protein [Candidatus Saccharibacteria bacterium]
MGRVTYIGNISPELLAWKIEAREALKYVKIVAESSIPVLELLNEDEAFLKAWLPDLEGVFRGDSPDADILGFYILKDGSVYIGFEIQSEFDIPYVLDLLAVPKSGLSLTIDVYCQELKHTDRYVIYYDEKGTRLVEHGLKGEEVVEIRTIPLNINPNLKLVSKWP